MQIEKGYRAVVWDIDEENLAKCCEAIIDSETAQGALHYAFQWCDDAKSSK